MCRVAVRDLIASPQAPADTRHWAAGVLRRWGLDGEVDRTLLVLNELVTNAFVHSPGASGCRISVDGGRLEVLVTDAGGGPPRRALRGAGNPDPAAWERSGGRGLQIVAAVADSWGTTFAGGRSGVWARWPVGPGWTFATGCVCRGDGADAVLLASGSRVVSMPGPWDSQADDPGPMLSGR